MSIGIINPEVVDALKEVQEKYGAVRYESFKGCPEDYKEMEYERAFMDGYVTGCRKSGRPWMSLFLTFLTKREMDSPYKEQRIEYLESELKRIKANG